MLSVKNSTKWSRTGIIGGMALLAVTAGLFLSRPEVVGAMANDGKKGCLSCHEGIEDINPKMTKMFRESMGKNAGFECIVCHSGKPEATDKLAAHQGMISNPADLSVAEKVCGTCHQQVVDRVEKSLMANVQGEIAGTLYARGYTGDKETHFAMSATPIVNKDDNTPRERGAMKRLDPIPESSEHISVEMLRKFCIKCHLRGDGVKTAKNYRSAGCAACHMLTSNDGTYAGNDPTMKGKPWRAAQHRITTKIPAEQCARCHKGGNRIGVSFVGELAGHEADVHFQRGINCIDCHTSKEIHGDGNIYPRMSNAVRIRCQSCHGTPSAPPSLADMDGTMLTNLKKDGDRVILKSRVTGKDHVVSVLETIKMKGRLATAMQIPQHVERMECDACHATKTVNCYVCHFNVDRTKMGKDLLTGKESPGLWSADASEMALKWKQPPLSMHQTGKVAPNQLGCAVHISETGADGSKVSQFAVNPATGGRTTDGYTAFGRISEANSHTIQRGGQRSCNECHNDPAALGLGGAKPETSKSGKKLAVDPDRLVNEEGKQQLAFTQPGQRPLNKDEMERIRRVGECTKCHAGENIQFWNNFSGAYSKIKANPQEHTKKVEQLLGK